MDLHSLGQVFVVKSLVVPIFKVNMVGEWGGGGGWGGKGVGEGFGMLKPTSTETIISDIIIHDISHNVNTNTIINIPTVIILSIRSYRALKTM